MVDYRKMHINLMDNYMKVWWKLFNNIDNVRWNNFLSLVELLFTILISYGHLEMLKSNRQSSLGENMLNNLCIHLEGPSLSQWNVKGTVQLWWNDKIYRPNRASKPCSSHDQSALIVSDSEDEDKEPQLILDEWEEWLESLWHNVITFNYNMSLDLRKATFDTQL